jgi:hypothetical protein
MVNKYLPIDVAIDLVITDLPIDRAIDCCPFVSRHDLELNLMLIIIIHFVLLYVSNFTKRILLDVISGTGALWLHACHRRISRGHLVSFSTSSPSTSLEATLADWFVIGLYSGFRLSEWARPANFHRYQS